MESTEAQATETDRQACERDVSPPSSAGKDPRETSSPPLASPTAQLDAAARRARLMELLTAWSQGDKGAEAELYATTWTELRQVAHRALRLYGGRDQLQTTALVSECYLKLARSTPQVDGVGHFIALCARAMRQVLIDHARRTLAQKRLPVAQERDETDMAISYVWARPESVVALEQLFVDLEQRDPRLARIAECRIIAGMEPPVIAATFGITERTVQREWNRIRMLIELALEAQ